MTESVEFIQRFREAVAAHGWRQPASPTEILDSWEQFVQSCEDGYDWSIYEYENEISVRDLIEAMLNDEQLVATAQMEWFRERTGEIDSRLKAVLSPEPVIQSAGTPWWRAHVPTYAGSELAADLETRYGVVVDVR